MKKILIILIAVISMMHAGYKVLDEEIKDKRTYIQVGSYQILEFDKMISKVRVKDDSNIEVSFLTDKRKPLKLLKLFAKKFGKTTLLITFADNTNSQIECYVVKDYQKIISVAKAIAPNLIVEQTKGKIILKGSTPNQKAKDQVLDMFKKSGVNLDTDMIDLAVLENPDKMVRVKLYVVEINNDKGLDLKNNWFVSSKNYMQSVDEDGLYTNYDVNQVSKSNAQINPTLTNSVDALMANAVSLTGGLTGAANYLGKYFNAGLTLNYLSSKGVANILDETTLVTLENKESNFLAGGRVYVKITKLSAEGIPGTEIREINYGLELVVNVKNIVGGNFVNLEITTKSTDPDWSNQVDGIPSFTEKSIKTNVISANQATIVLGGLVNREDAEDIDKIPLLGDIPILGALFTSKSFREGKSELVFFITPEIVDPNNNSQRISFERKTNFTDRIDEKFDKAQIERQERIDEEEREKEQERLEKERKAKEAQSNKSTKKAATSNDLHQQHLKLLGY